MIRETRNERFYGGDYNHERDHKRLTGQLLAIWDVFKDGQWHTLQSLSEATGAPEASISAGLRTFRRPERGGHIVTKEFTHNGQYRYRLGKRQPAPQVVPEDSAYDRAVKSLQRTGHGHVVERMDGSKNRCGGAALCKICQREKSYLETQKGKL